LKGVLEISFNNDTLFARACLCFSISSTTKHGNCDRSTSSKGLIAPVGTYYK
jgi:hypothetical protein